MNKPRACGCKGCRTCLICEATYKLEINEDPISKVNGFVYCLFCQKAYKGWNLDEYKKHPNHDSPPIDYPGVYIQLNFITPEEELSLLESVDNIPWSLSQSGRRKQNNGPKCNFKKKKLKTGEFKGFPKFTEFVSEKLEKVPILENFQTIEQCFLEYVTEKGSSIDPHVDDCWVWGERIVTVNLLSDSVLTMSYNKKPNYYNLQDVGEYPQVLDKNGSLRTVPEAFKFLLEKSDVIVRIPMPRLSLLVLYDSARYEWEHQILREDVQERRVCIAYREFTPPFFSDEKGREVLQIAQNFY